MMLTAERLKEVVSYDSETGKFFWLDRAASDFKSPQAFGVFKNVYHGKEAGGALGNGYLRFSVDGKHYLAHRLAWLFHYGQWPAGQIDHINGKRSDNRIENLRDVPQEENQRNMKRQRRNQSGVTGVSFYPKYGSWKAVIWANSKAIHLGSFPTKSEAVAARKAAERRLGYHPNHGREAA